MGGLLQPLEWGLCEWTCPEIIPACPLHVQCDHCLREMRPHSHRSSALSVPPHLQGVLPFDLCSQIVPWAPMEGLIRRVVSALEKKLLTLSFPYTQLELGSKHAAQSRETSANTDSADACLLPNYT